MAVPVKKTRIPAGEYQSARGIMGRKAQTTVGGPSVLGYVPSIGTSRREQVMRSSNMTLGLVAIVGGMFLTGGVDPAFGQAGAVFDTGKSARPTVATEARSVSTDVVASPYGIESAPTGAGRSVNSVGPDIIVADLQQVIRFGQVGNITAYGVGTNACNVGNERVSWIAHKNQHPVISQSMYRLKDNRFEQIGMSWLSHGFYAVSQSFCTPCLDPTDGSELGVGCSDPLSGVCNGIQNNMSLRSDINAHTGDFAYPWTAPGWVETIDRRLQVHDADIDPALNERAVYFVQAHYITADDAAAGNGNNNASYRPVTVTVSEYNPPNTYNVIVTGVTQREQPAIRAWQDTDPWIEETDIQVPGDGLFIVATAAIDLRGGWWRYEYAVQNLNSDCSAGSFSVPVPRDAVITNIGFHDVDYHSGEIYDTTDWPATVEHGSITWATEPYGANENANALRFDTLYNFYFDTNVGPDATTITLGLFKPSVLPEVTGSSIGPALPLVDCNNNGIPDDCDIDCDAPGCMPPCGGSEDCNDNAIPDECDIDSGTSRDANGNGIPDECELALDIKPRSCPNPVNLRSQGVLPVALIGSELFDVTQVDVDSLALARADGVGGSVAPLTGPRRLRPRVADVATAFDGEPCECHDIGPDGIDDLVLKFSTPEMVETLELGSLPRGTSVMLTLSGSLLDGTEFEASDCIVIVGKYVPGTLRGGRKPR